jgi:hypothetical protein
LLDGVNTLEFHPDFQRLRDLDYPVANDADVYCSLPHIEFSGALATLTSRDGSVSHLVPSRLFLPGDLALPKDDCRVLAAYEDGRPALIKRANILAWTSNMASQMNSALIHRWQLTWELSGHWNYEAPDGAARPDSLISEELAPLTCDVLADLTRTGAVAITDVRRHTDDRSLEIDLSGGKPAQEVMVVYRVFDWQGGIVATGSQKVAMAADGSGQLFVDIPEVTTAGEQSRHEYLVRAGVRTYDFVHGFSYIERIVRFDPPVSISIATDSAASRRAILPPRLDYCSSFRSRYLWWPLIEQDQGSSVYLDGETCHAVVTLTNNTAESVSGTLVESFEKPMATAIVASQKCEYRIAPGQAQSFPIAERLDGAFEPYVIDATCTCGGHVAEARFGVTAIRPNRQTHNIDNPPGGPGFSFTVYCPLTYLEMPDNLIPTPPHDVYFGNYPAFIDWELATCTGTDGNGGGVNGYTGVTRGLAWGPFYCPHTGAPNQMSTMPNGQPYMSCIADAIRRQRSAPGLFEVADYWANYWTPLNWSTLFAFREWLRTNRPEDAARFAPQSLAECTDLLKGDLRADWDEWQNVIVVAAWKDIEAAVPPGTGFWSQAELAILAIGGAHNAVTNSSYDGGPILAVLAGRDLAGDVDPATSRMGWGFRYREYAEATTAALAPTAHFNPTVLRHMCFLNDQHWRNKGNATAEEYRAEAYDTLYSAAVRPDGTLRVTLDTPTSETALYPNAPASGLKEGNRMYDRLYRLGSVLGPESALGLLWVAPVQRATPGDKQPDSRTVYEALRNNGVDLAAMVSPQFLSATSKTGAAGIVWLLPNAIKPDEIVGLKQAMASGLAVVAIAAPEQTQAVSQLPPGVKLFMLPAGFLEASRLTPEEASSLAANVVRATNCPVTVGDGACVSAFRALDRTFLIVQNMRPYAVNDVKVTLRAAGASKRAFDIDAATALPVRSIAPGLEITATLGPWDAHMIVVGN